MRVKEIFLSISGEQNILGIGYVCMFVRLHGCNIKCYQCDTPDCLVGDDYREMTPEQVMDEMLIKMQENPITAVVITGGEPLLQYNELNEFIGILLKHDMEVIIETNGTISISKIIDVHPEFVSFVVDYKTVTSGVKKEFEEANFDYLRRQDFLKFVILDSSDYMEMFGVVHNLTIMREVRVCVGLHSHSKMTYPELFQKLVEDKLLGSLVDTINFQAHKLLNFK